MHGEMTGLFPGEVDFQSLRKIRLRSLVPKPILPAVVSSRPMKITVQFAALLSLVGAPCAQGVDFEKEVLPIFEKNCFKCHGDGKAKAGVRLDADRIGGAIGDVIVPGDLEKSEVYTSMIAEDSDDRMPPPGKGPTMSQKEIDTVKQWILEGAPLPGGPAVAKAGESKSGLPARVEPVTSEFTNREGRAITATLLRVVEGAAVLRMADGKIYNYPIEKLSDESQKVVRDFEKAEQG